MKLFYILLAITISLGGLNLAQAQGQFVPDLSTAFGSNEISLEDLTLEQKVAQMIITHGADYNLEALKKLQMGGLHFYHKASSGLYNEVIDEYQKGMDIPFFTTADLEGCINPFSYFRTFPDTSSVQTPEEAYQKAVTEGTFLKSMGFNVNFAPVVDLDDTIWRCRTFPGEKEDVVEMAAAYAAGLREVGILSTMKHYPGKTLVVSDPHQNLVSAEIADEDTFPYGELLEHIDMLMVSHIIVEGTVSSNGVPSSVSPEIILPIKEVFPGLIVSDEINMLGLLDFYGDDLDALYIDLVLAGHDIILNFNEDPNELYRMIIVIVAAVEDGSISEDQIDASVRKILEKKGITVI